METLLSRKSKIKRDLPLTELNLIFYPIKMTYYDEFKSYINALVIRQSTLPVKYLSYDYLTAVTKFDFDNILNGGKSSGILFDLLSLLFMSLRIDIDKDMINKSIELAQTDNGIEVKKIIVSQDNNKVEISPMEFSTIIRPLIAEQNGVELPDESENIDIIKDYEYLQSKNRDDSLNVNTEDLIASVATYQRMREKDIYDWSIREFENKVKAINRIIRHQIFTQAEMSGTVTFKQGNPAPSWCYDKLDNNFGTVDYQKIKQKIGDVAKPK